MQPKSKAQYGSVPHDATSNVSVDLRVAGSTGLARNPQITGIHEFDEFGGLVVEENGGVGRIR
jgi:hypothetical protein